MHHINACTFDEVFRPQTSTTPNRPFILVKVAMER
jgi:hypothetical protein